MRFRFPLVLAFILLFIALPSLHSMTFALFDLLPPEDQAEFVARLIDETEIALRQNGDAASADKIDKLFSTILPGDKIPLGIVEYGRNEDRGRVFDLQRHIKDPHAERLWVEDCLFVTLKKNQIPLPESVTRAVYGKMANFHPQTYAQFMAMSPDQRRHYVAIMMKFGWPDTRFRELMAAEMKEHKSEPLDLMPELVNAEFPMGVGNQPGFERFVRFYSAANAKTPKSAYTMLQLELYLLNAQDAGVVRKMDTMDSTAVMLPDGRHVYRDKNGNLWAVGGHDDPGKMLTGADRDLAIRLANCKAAKGIRNGTQALAACRSEVGLPPQ
ncbi:MAG TPA: hypothetical protein VG844_11130 [Terracidiphilus sp.]|nr:hypothetical protein [Terracidiphilus sp.]